MDGVLVTALDSDNVEAAGALMGREQDVARSRHPTLPHLYSSPGRCAEALAAELGSGASGVVARIGGREVGVLCARAAPGYAAVPAHGIALDPSLGDAAPALAAMYASVGAELLRRGLVWHVVTALDLPAPQSALADLGFGRHAVYASQTTRPAPHGDHVAVRVGTVDDLDTIAALSQIEVDHRFTPPIWAAPHPSGIEDTRARHVRLFEERATHLLASIGGRDVGLLTIEDTPQPRLCAAGQPYIGPTATAPAARGKGVGRVLVAAALEWSYRHGFQSLSVDFSPSNPLSRPFWLGQGFRPVGYGTTRAVHPAHGGRAEKAPR